MYDLIGYVRRILVSLWNYMVELRHCLKMKNEGKEIREINSSLINQNSIFLILENPLEQVGDTSKVFVGPAKKNAPDGLNVVYIDM